MADTLFTQTLALARELGIVFEGEADSGSTATKIIDAALTQQEQAFKGGTLWILTGTYASTSKIVTAQPATELHFETLAGAVGVGDDYAVAEPGVPRDALRRAINKALLEIPEYTAYDDSSLTTVADQEEYTLPAGIGELDSVEIATYEAAPYHYYHHMHNYVRNDGKLAFTKNVPGISGYKIRLGYPSRHAWLYNDSDTINPGVNPEKLKWEAAVIVWREYLQQRDSRDLDSLNEDWFDEAKRLAHTKTPHRTKRLVMKGMP